MTAFLSILPQDKNEYLLHEKLVYDMIQINASALDLVTSDLLFAVDVNGVHSDMLYIDLLRNPYYCTTPGQYISEYSFVEYVTNGSLFDGIYSNVYQSIKSNLYMYLYKLQHSVKFSDEELKNLNQLYQSADVYIKQQYQTILSTMSQTIDMQNLQLPSQLRQVIDNLDIGQIQSSIENQWALIQDQLDKSQKFTQIVEQVESVVTQMTSYTHSLNATVTKIMQQLMSDVGQYLPSLLPKCKTIYENYQNHAKVFLGRILILNQKSECTLLDSSYLAGLQTGSFLKLNSDSEEKLVQQYELVKSKIMPHNNLQTVKFTSTYDMSIMEIIPSAGVLAGVVAFMFLNLPLTLAVRVATAGIGARSVVEDNDKQNNQKTRHTSKNKRFTKLVDAFSSLDKKTIRKIVKYENRAQSVILEWDGSLLCDEDWVDELADYGIQGDINVYREFNGVFKWVKRSPHQLLGKGMPWDRIRFEGGAGMYMVELSVIKRKYLNKTDIGSTPVELHHPSDESLDYGLSSYKSQEECYCFNCQYGLGGLNSYSAMQLMFDGEVHSGDWSTTNSMYDVYAGQYLDWTQITDNDDYGPLGSLTEFQQDLPRYGARNVTTEEQQKIDKEIKQQQLEQVLEFIGPDLNNQKGKTEDVSSSEEELIDPVVEKKLVLDQKQRPEIEKKNFKIDNGSGYNKQQKIHQDRGGKTYKQKKQAYERQLEKDQQKFANIGDVGFVPVQKKNNYVQVHQDGKTFSVYTKDGVLRTQGKHARLDEQTVEQFQKMKLQNGWKGIKTNYERKYRDDNAIKYLHQTPTSRPITYNVVIIQIRNILYAHNQYDKLQEVINKYGRITGFVNGLHKIYNYHPLSTLYTLLDTPIQKVIDFIERFLDEFVFNIRKQGTVVQIKNQIQQRLDLKLKSKLRILTDDDEVDKEFQELVGRTTSDDNIQLLENMSSQQKKMNPLIIPHKQLEDLAKVYPVYSKFNADGTQEIMLPELSETPVLKLKKKEKKPLNIKAANFNPYSDVYTLVSKKFFQKYSNMFDQGYAISAGIDLSYLQIDYYIQLFHLFQHFKIDNQSSNQTLAWQMMNLSTSTQKAINHQNDYVTYYRRQILDSLDKPFFHLVKNKKGYYEWKYDKIYVNNFDSNLAEALMVMTYMQAGLLQVDKKGHLTNDARPCTQCIEELKIQLRSQFLEGLSKKDANYEKVRDHNISVQKQLNDLKIGKGPLQEFDMGEDSAPYINVIKTLDLKSVSLALTPDKFVPITPNMDHTGDCLTLLKSQLNLHQNMSQKEVLLYLEQQMSIFPEGLSYNKSSLIYIRLCINKGEYHIQLELSGHRPGEAMDLFSKIRQESLENIAQPGFSVDEILFVLGQPVLNFEKQCLKNLCTSLGFSYRNDFSLQALCFLNQITLLHDGYYYSDIPKRAILLRDNHVCYYGEVFNNTIHDYFVPKAGQVIQGPPGKKKEGEAAYIRKSKPPKENKDTGPRKSEKKEARERKQKQTDEIKQVVEEPKQTLDEEDSHDEDVDTLFADFTVPKFTNKLFTQDGDKIIRKPFLEQYISYQHLVTPNTFVHLPLIPNSLKFTDQFCLYVGADYIQSFDYKEYNGLVELPEFVYNKDATNFTVIPQMWKTWKNSCAYEWIADWYLPIHHSDTHISGKDVKGLIPGKDYFFPNFYKTEYVNGVPSMPTFFDLMKVMEYNYHKTAVQLKVTGSQKNFLVSVYYTIDLCILVTQDQKHKEIYKANVPLFNKEFVEFQCTNKACYILNLTYDEANQMPHMETHRSTLNPTIQKFYFYGVNGMSTLSELPYYKNFSSRIIPETYVKEFTGIPSLPSEDMETYNILTGKTQDDETEKEVSFYQAIPVDPKFKKLTVAQKYQVVRGGTFMKSKIWDTVSTNKVLMKNFENTVNRNQFLEMVRTLESQLGEDEKVVKDEVVDEQYKQAVKKQALRTVDKRARQVIFSNTPQECIGQIAVICPECRLSDPSIGKNQAKAFQRFLKHENWIDNENDIYLVYTCQTASGSVNFINYTVGAYGKFKSNLLPEFRSFSLSHNSTVPDVESVITVMNKRYQVVSVNKVAINPFFIIYQLKLTSTDDNMVIYPYIGQHIFKDTFLPEELYGSILGLSGVSGFTKEDKNRQNLQEAYTRFVLSGIYQASLPYISIDGLKMVRQIINAVVNQDQSDLDQQKVFIVDQSWLFKLLFEHRTNLDYWQLVLISPLSIALKPRYLYQAIFFYCLNLLILVAFVLKYFKPYWSYFTHYYLHFVWMQLELSYTGAYRQLIQNLVKKTWCNWYYTNAIQFEYAEDIVYESPWLNLITAVGRVMKTHYYLLHTMVYSVYVWLFSRWGLNLGVDENHIYGFALLIFWFASHHRKAPGAEYVKEIKKATIGVRQKPHDKGPTHVKHLPTDASIPDGVTGCNMNNYNGKVICNFKPLNLILNESLKSFQRLQEVTHNCFQKFYRNVTDPKMPVGTCVNSYSNCSGASQKALMRQVNPTVLPDPLCVKQLYRNVRDSLDNLPLADYHYVISDYIDNVRRNDPTKAKNYQLILDRLNFNLASKVRYNQFEQIVKSGEFFKTNQSGVSQGRPRNICDPTPEWKVLGGFANFLLSQWMLKKMPFSCCGMNMRDMRSVMSSHHDVILSLDGSNHDAHQHHSLLKAVIHQILDYYLDDIELCFKMSGLGFFWNDVQQGLKNLTYNIFRGNPLEWQATIKGTIFSGIYNTYFANSVLVHCYIRTMMGLQCFTEVPDFNDKCSGDDQIIGMSRDMHQKLIKRVPLYYSTAQTSVTNHGLGQVLKTIEYSGQFCSRQSYPDGKKFTWSRILKPGDYGCHNSGTISENQILPISQLSAMRHHSNKVWASGLPGYSQMYYDVEQPDKLPFDSKQIMKIKMYQNYICDPYPMAEQLCVFENQQYLAPIEEQSHPIEDQYYNTNLEVIPKDDSSTNDALLGKIQIQKIQVKSFKNFLAEQIGQPRIGFRDVEAYTHLDDQDQVISPQRSLNSQNFTDNQGSNAQTQPRDRKDKKSDRNSQRQSRPTNTNQNRRKYYDQGKKRLTNQERRVLYNKAHEGYEQLYEPEFAQVIAGNNQGHYKDFYKSAREDKVYLTKKQLNDVVSGKLVEYLQTLDTFQGYSPYELKKIIAFDDVYSVLTNGASSVLGGLYDHFKGNLPPGIAPLIDKGIQKAKNYIASIAGGNMTKKLANALTSPHTTKSVSTAIQGLGKNNSLTLGAPTQLYAQTQLYDSVKGARTGNYIQGISHGAYKTVMCPLYMDPAHMTRLPYGSTASSLYKRILGVQVSNKFYDTTTGAAYYADKIAILYTPMNFISHVVALNATYNPTYQGTIANGDVSVVTANRTQQVFQHPFRPNLPEMLSYRLIGSQVSLEYIGNMIDVQGMATAVSIRYPNENVAVSRVGMQQTNNWKGAGTVGQALLASSPYNGYGFEANRHFNVWEAGPKGYADLTLDPTRFTSDQTFIQKPVSQIITNTMPLTDIEDASYIDPYVQFFIAGAPSGRISQLNMFSTGWSGSSVVNPIVEQGVIGPIHVIIVQGLKNDAEQPFRFTMAGAFETVLQSNTQFLNPPEKPDYSQETLPAIIRDACVVGGVWSRTGVVEPTLG